MPEVLSRSGKPILSDFANAKGTPLVVNEDNGRCYVLVNNQVTPVDGTGIQNILDYEPNAGDGVTDVIGPLQNAIDDAAAAGGGHIVFPGGGRTYRFLNGLAHNSIGNNLIIEGLGGSFISKEFDGTLFPLIGGQGNVKIKNLTVNANGQTYAGELVYFGQFSENIHIEGWTVTNGWTSILTYQHDGGDHSWITGCKFTIHADNLSGAVVTNDSADTGATRRFWQNTHCGLSTWFYKGTGLQTFYASEVYSSGFSFTGDTSLGVTIRGCRMAIPAGEHATMDGNSLIIIGNEIGGDLTINSTFINGQFRANVMDPSKTWVNNGPASSRIEDPRTPYP